MAQNKVMKLWTAVITAFLALFTALGLITTTAAAAVPQTQPARNSAGTHPEPLAMSHGLWSHIRSLPPTMKQRIRAEAHGKTPSCRPRSLADTDTDTATEADTTEPAAADCA
jgi:Spy/CpxP family protein refolding chaperone